MPTDPQIYEITALTSDPTVVGWQVWEDGQYCCEIDGYPTGNVLGQEGEVLELVLVDAFGNPVDTMNWVVPATEPGEIVMQLVGVATVAALYKWRRWGGR
jgi:hypothetical protein